VARLAIIDKKLSNVLNAKQVRGCAFHCCRRAASALNAIRVLTGSRLFLFAFENWMASCWKKMNTKMDEAPLLMCLRVCYDGE
jgi:hypothetical protein